MWQSHLDQASPEDDEALVQRYWALTEEISEIARFMSALAERS
jgi:hypothetical protein